MIPDADDNGFRRASWRFIAGGVTIAILTLCATWSNPYLAVGPISGVLIGLGFVAVGLILRALAPRGQGRQK